MAEKGLSYVRSFVVDEDPEQVIQQFLSVTAGTPEYTVASAGSGSIVCTRRFTPTWAIVVAVVGILFLLVGLLALFVKETETLTISAVRSPEGTRVSISGVASAALAGRLNAALAAVGPDVISPTATAAPGGGERDQWHCPSCGAQQPRTASGCDNCGEQRPVSSVIAPLSAPADAVCPDGHTVPASNRFCPECGRSLHPQCRSGHDLAPDAKFCGVCGEPAAAESARGVT